MKHFILAGWLCISGILGFAQLPPLTSAAASYGICQLNGTYYFTTTNGEVRKIDQNSPGVSTLVVSGLNNPKGLTIDGPLIYVAEYGANKVSKFNYSDSNPTVTDHITGLSGPFDIDIIGTKLYISEKEADRISKTSTTDINPILTTYISGVSEPTYFARKDEYMYCSLLGSDKIIKFNNDGPWPIVEEIQTGLSNPTGLTISDDILFFAEAGTNSVSKVDIDHPYSIPILIFASDFSNPQALSGDLNHILVSDFDNARLILYNVVFVNFEKNNSQNILILPNPSTNNIQLKGLVETQSYSVFNALGAEISSGIAQPNQGINIENLSCGQYFIQLENGAQLKFVKQ